MATTDTEIIALSRVSAEESAPSDMDDRLLAMAEAVSPSDYTDDGEFSPDEKADMTRTFLTFLATGESKAPTYDPELPF